MTMLYESVLLESAEQAEALPDRTPYLTVLSDGTVIEAGIVGDEDAEDLTPKGDWHSVALVPIEADEEILTEDTYATSEQLRRYTTPWQRFTAPKEAS